MDQYKYLNCWSTLKKFPSFPCVLTIDWTSFIYVFCVYGCFVHLHTRRCLQTVVSCNVGAGNWTRIIWKSSQCSELPSQLSSLSKSFLQALFYRYRDTRKINQAWWHWPVILVLGKAKHENYSSSLGYKARPWYKENVLKQIWVILTPWTREQ